MKIYGIVIFLLVMQLVSAGEKSSKNAQWMKNVLKKYPRYDTNHDNVLTAKEAMVYLKDQREKALTPTFKDVSYAAFPADKLDVYIMKSSKPTPVLVFFHGGAFAGGDKRTQLPLPLLTACQKNGITVVSVNYRLSSDKDYHLTYSKKTPFPPPFQDAARAVQFIRLNAAKYNIDKNKLAVAGGSAGGGLALWLAFHDDLAKLGADDPVARESTKPQAVVAMFAQTTYDQEYIRNKMIYDGYKIAWINRLFRMNNKQLQSLETKVLRRSVSPLELVDSGDKVKVFLCLGGTDKVTPEMQQAKFVHNIIFYQHLVKKLQQYKVAYSWIHPNDYKTGKRKGSWDWDAANFLKKSFK